MLLVGNGKVITRDEALPYLEDGAVLLDGEAVREVGPLAELKAMDKTALTDILKACDFTSVSEGTFPQSFSYENQGDIYMVLPVSHALGDYAIVRYTPDTK